MVQKIINSILFRLQNYTPDPNKRIKESNWYQAIFPHLEEYKRLQRNADIICIGSTPAKNAIDFKPINEVNGYNLAVGPETIYYDFQVLKNYHAYLKKGGTVLFVLCPFTFLKDYYRDEFGSKAYLNERYYPILHRGLIDTYDERIYDKWVANPKKMGWRVVLRAYINRVHKKEEYTTNPETVLDSTNRCKTRLSAWMREFRMTDLNPAHIPAETENAIMGNIKIFKDMKTFIEERGYQAYIVIPPFPKEMVDIIPADLVEHNLINPVTQIGISCLNYYGKKEWLDRDLFYHGFLLNKRGRQLLTKDVLSRITV